MPRTRRRRLLQATAAAVVAFTAVITAAVFVLDALERTPEPTFGVGREGFVDRWNEAASAGGRPELLIPGVEWTDEGAGVFGHAFSPTLSVLGRVEGPLRDVVELAVVGTPAQDGEDLVLAALELGIAVAEPALAAEERTEVLGALGVLGPGRPAAPDGSVERLGTRFRSASDPDRGRIGLGAEAIGRG